MKRRASASPTPEVPDARASRKYVRRLRRGRDGGRLRPSCCRAEPWVAYESPRTTSSSSASAPWGARPRWRLADGLRVLGIDRFAPPHALGSSHGSSRILREAYFEHPLYVPFAQRALAAWREIEARAGAALLRTTGGLMIGPPRRRSGGRCARSARPHGLPHEVLAAGEARRRFPRRFGCRRARWRCGSRAPACSIPSAASRRCSPWRARRGPRCGSARRSELGGDGGEVRAETASGREGRRPGARRRAVDGDRLWRSWCRSRSSGPCSTGFARATAPSPSRRSAARSPSGRARPIASSTGFPTSHGLEAARHHQGEPTRAEAVRRSVEPRANDALRRLLERFMPYAAGAHERARRASTPTPRTGISSSTATRATRECGS